MELSVYRRESERTVSPLFHADRVPLGYFVDLALRVAQLASEVDGLKRTLFYGAANPRLAAFGGDPFPVGACGLPGFGQAAPVPPGHGARVGGGGGADGVGEPEAHRGAPVRTLADLGLDGHLLHAALGFITEGAEVFDAVQRPRLDRTHVLEEAGDLAWYLALLLRAVEGTQEEAHARNVAKLRRRYPAAFAQAEALDRDLTGERDALEAPV